MGQLINKKTVIDSETGEIMKENNWFGYDGFNNKGYIYRRKSIYIRYYFDTIPSNLSESATMLLLMMTELANEENVLVTRIERKSKFSNIIYLPLNKDEIRERLRFKYGQNKFDKCWKELKKQCIKRIKYHDNMAWAINPSIMSKCKQVPFWLYEEFQDYMNPYLSAITIKKLQNKINSLS